MLNSTAATFATLVSVNQVCRGNISLCGQVRFWERPNAWARTPGRSMAVVMVRVALSAARC